MASAIQVQKARLIMKTRIPLLIPFVAVGLASVCSAALATEYGNVVSSTPVTAQVAVPQQSCQNVTQVRAPETSGGGAVAGALIGGLAGNAIGGGAGRALATGLGVVAGAITGNNIEAANTPPQQVNSLVCQNGASYVNRVIRYDVTYDYQGQRYQARVPQDPGDRIAVNVSVTATGDTSSPAVMQQQVVPAMSSTTVYVDNPDSGLYPPYAPYAPYAPYGYYGYGSFGGPVIGIGAHFGGGFHHGRRF